MKNGILFYSNNPYPLILFAVATNSLIKYYDGNIHIVFGLNTPKFIYKILDKQDRISYSNVKQRYTDAKIEGTTKEEWREKPFIIRNESPFDNTLYFDCDHCFYKSISLKVFKNIEDLGLCTAMNKAKPNRHLKIEQEYRDMGENVKNYYKVNGGCIGYKKGCSHIDSWIKKMHKYRKNGGFIIQNNSEEFALGYLINKGLGGRINRNISVCLSRYDIEKPIDKNVIGMHYVANRWLLALSWEKQLVDAYNNNHLCLHDKINKYYDFKNKIKLKLNKNGINI